MDKPERFLLWLFLVAGAFVLGSSVRGCVANNYEVYHACAHYDPKSGDLVWNDEKSQ